MKLEEQVVSLELAKRLKELGVKQGQSYFAYYGNAGKWSGAIVENEAYVDVDSEFREYKLCDAFTVAELGEMLPACSYTRKSTNPKGIWAIITDGLGVEHRTESRTEADARAKMLIYLIEQGIVKP